MLYRYKAIDKNGKTVKSTIEAASMDEASKKIYTEGLLYEYIKPTKPSLLAQLRNQKREKINPNLLAKLSRDLSIYLGAGISIVNAVRLASSQYKDDKKLANLLLSTATLLDEGKSFYQALDSQTLYELPLFYKESIRISEDGGVLASVLEELSRFIKELESIKKQARGALFYPLFIIVLSFFMVIFMMTVVVPQITGMFEQLGQELPPLTQFVIGVSDFLSDYWLILTAILLGFVFLHSLSIKTNQNYAYMVDKFKLKIPFLGRIIMTTELARFAYMSSVLMRSGVPFVQTIRLAANVQANRVLAKLFVDSAKKVVEGGRFSVALQSGDFSVDSAFLQSIALGEETSELEAILSNLSTLYFEENRDQITLFLSLLEPLMMLFVGGVVGFIITAMLLPIFSMNIGI